MTHINVDASEKHIQTLVDILVYRLNNILMLVFN